jgi:hypothetical protein
MELRAKFINLVVGLAEGGDITTGCNKFGISLGTFEVPSYKGIT